MSLLIDCAISSYCDPEFSLFSTSAAQTSQRNPGSSTHSISSATPPDRLRFPRGTLSRSTFHGGQLRERRTATYNGPPASPTLSHDATPLSQSRSRGSTNLFTKLTSKLTRRYMNASCSQYTTNLPTHLCGVTITYGSQFSVQ